MKILGVTGNLASGKTEITCLFKKLGAETFDADVAAKRATRKGTPIYSAIVKIFGKDFLAKDGQLDRRKLAGRVFSHPADLKKLNTLTHPGVIVEIFKTIERLKGRKGLLVLDVPLLFEAKMHRLVDWTAVVRASRENMLSRSAKKGVPRALALKILASQWPAEKKAVMADYVIENNGTLKELEREVREIFFQIKD